MLALRGADERDMTVLSPLRVWCIYVMYRSGWLAKKDISDSELNQIDDADCYALLMRCRCDPACVVVVFPLNAVCPISLDSLQLWNLYKNIPEIRPRVSRQKRNNLEWNPTTKTQNPKPKNLRQATYFACLKVESWRLLELQNFNFISEYLTKKSKILEINYGKIQEVRNWVHEICWPENSNKETHREIGPPSTCA